MSYKSRLILTTFNVWGSHILVIPVTFSKHVIPVYVIVQGHVHPAHIFLPVLSGTIMIWGRDCVVPLLWGIWGLPVLAQNLYDWRAIGLIHGLETDIIRKETIIISGRGCCIVPAYVVLQISSLRPDTVFKVLWDPGLEVLPDLVGRGSANDSY